MHVERVGQWRPEDNDEWEEVTDMGASFLDPGFNILAKTSGSSHNALPARLFKTWIQQWVIANKTELLE